MASSKIHRGPATLLPAIHDKCSTAAALPAGACSRETLSRLSQLTLAGDHPAAGEVQKGHPPAGQPWRTRCPECQRLQVYDLVWQQADAKGSVEVAHLACCRCGGR